MPGRKRSLLEKFISGLAEVSSDVSDKKSKKTSRVTKGRKAPAKEMLGTGMARKAAAKLSGRGRQLEEQERGIIGR